MTLLFQGDEKARQEYYRRRLLETPAKLPPATVIVPVKGPEEALAGNLASMAALDYPDFELIVVAASKDDIPEGVIPAKARVVIAGAGDATTGAKVNNLVAAVKAARSQSQILAFADSDGLVAPGWLKALAGPLADPNVGASTGYRFHTPAHPAGFWPLLRSAWNGVIAGGFHPKDNDFCWGGATAITRQYFKKAKVEEHWKGAVSDDYQLSRAVHNAGLTIAFAPGALTADTSHINSADFLLWTIRQLVITRVYAPKLWRLGLAAHLIYCAAWPAALYMLLNGVAWGPIALAATVYLGARKAKRRTRLIRAAMAFQEPWFRRYAWTQWALNPLSTWVWLYAFLYSATSRTIDWRGRRYTLKGPNSTTE
jgi:cellulose synthase/poly-beta-1,6-N-acetylglucosamine synthase-like glycosyltransferase